MFDQKNVEKIHQLNKIRLHTHINSLKFQQRNNTEKNSNFMFKY